ncbi:MAG: biopolymer transporter ExbD [Gammaproteobacteria bacterium]|nr:biopolymer transporter ExbD [Gammaproteobacteria bacterium]MBQ0838212.1 biopolymer transporter ExbD [Gammaproteobacteria bacterium]
MFNLGGEHEQRKQLDGNMLPVINMTFLLLLFFIVVGSFSETYNKDIAPPQSSSESLTADAEELSLSGDGKLWWRGESTTLANWASQLQAEGQAVPSRVSLRADGRTPAAVIIPLIDELKLLKVSRVALVTVNDPGML